MSGESETISNTGKGLTDTQEIFLSLLTIFSSILSIIGSSLIIFRILKWEERLGSYHRIIFGLSCADLIGSIMHIMEPFLVPADSPEARVWAKGTKATCSFLGFLSQLSISVIAYNSFLSCYYLVTIRFGVKKDTFAKLYEGWMHGTIISFFVLTACLGLLFGYSELNYGIGCWISCTETVGSQTCQNTTYVEWAFGALPILLVFISLPIAHLSIYCYVRKQLDRRRLSGSNQLPTSGTDPDSPALDTSTQTDETALHADRIKEVAKQSFLYVASFFLCYTALYVVRTLESMRIATESELYPLLIFSSFLPPLQGFFNVLVYIRPNFQRARAMYQSESTIWLLKQCLFDHDVPRMAEPTRRRKERTTEAAGLAPSLKMDHLGHSTRTVSSLASSRRRSTLMEIPEVDENLDENEKETNDDAPPMTSFSRRSSENETYPPVMIAANTAPELAEGGSPRVVRGTDFDDQFYEKIRTTIRRVDMAGRNSESGFWPNLSAENTAKDAQS